MTTLLSSVALEAAQADAPPSLVSRIYCGRDIPTGGAVTDADLDAFVDEILSARFPAGFTVLPGVGGWRDTETGQTIREQSVVFEVMHAPAQAGAVCDVARAYKARFAQQGVGVTTTPMAVQFI